MSCFEAWVGLDSESERWLNSVGVAGCRSSLLPISHNSKAIVLVLVCKPAKLRNYQTNTENQENQGNQDTKIAATHTQCWWPILKGIWQVHTTEQPSFIFCVSWGFLTAKLTSYRYLALYKMFVTVLQDYSSTRILGSSLPRVFFL